jgi:uncharacterized protein YjbI with pentapeptide repeats
MANQAHVDVLVQGTEAVQRWQAENPGMPLDVSGVVLADLRLYGASLERANFRDARCPNSSFRGANLSDADLRGANLENCDLTEAILRKADLTGANLTNAHLGQADVTEANCENANFTTVDLVTTKYDGAIFRRAVFIRASLPHDLLRNNNCEMANFQQTVLSRADLSGKDLSSCNFAGANLAGAAFRGATLKSVRFDECDLRAADMSDADCELADFQRATLTEARLRNASLRGANFTTANLNDSDITHADFYEATLTDARMGRLLGAKAARNLLTTRIERPVHYFESAVLSPVDKWLDWEHVRIAGRLPLFGASYSALVSIPLFFYAWEIYNDKVLLLRSWAEKSLAGTATNDYYIAQTVLQHLHKLPVPTLSELLLVSTLFLAIASTIYALSCPSRVKEFSLDQWRYQLRLSVVHYMADAWRRRPLRVAALVFYIAGGFGAGFVLLYKLVGVAKLLVGSHAWSLLG